MLINDFNFKIIKNKLSNMDIDIYFSGSIIFSEFPNGSKYILNDIIADNDFNEIIEWCEYKINNPQVIERSEIIQGL